MFLVDDQLPPHSHAFSSPGMTASQLTEYNFPNSLGQNKGFPGFFPGVFPGDIRYFGFRLPTTNRWRWHDPTGLSSRADG